MSFPGFDDYDMENSDDEHGDENQQVTELDIEHINAEDLHCACGRGGCGRGTDRGCKCYKNGAGCSSTCKCTNCKNYLNVLESFFGKEDVRATRCFRQWLHESAKSRKPIDLKSPATQETLRSMLFDVENGDVNAKPQGDLFSNEFYDKDLFQLGRDWVKPGVTEEERKPLLKALFISAFGEDPAKPYTEWFYSFCRETWQQSACTRHCEICHECNDWTQWHCKVCNVCAFAQSLPCDGCGGVSETYATMKKFGG